MPQVSSRRSGHRLNWPQLYLAVALTTVSSLLLELALTRIFSVVFYYHFAFLAISIALFGLGAGGVLSYAAARTASNIFLRLGWIAACNSAVVVLSLAFVLSRRDLSYLTLALIYFACALPFLLSGIILAVAVAETVRRVDRVYFADLLGAAIGCLALVPLLNSFGGPNTVLTAAVLFAVSSSLWFSLGGKAIGRAAGVGLALVLVALVAVNMRWRIIDVTYAKGAELHNETYVKWNSFSRVALRQGGSGSAEILIDADSSSPIATVDLADPKERNALTRHASAVPYALRPEAAAVILGAGGGQQVARALAAGARQVTAVEINPIIANTIMRRQYAALSHNLYLRPEVRVTVEDGRSFVRRSTDRFDVIQASAAQTWGATAAGAFALSENHLYTSEAFVDYLHHLSDRGMLAFTLWGFDPPRESLRLVSIGMEALRRVGEPDASQHYIVMRQGSGVGATDTVLLSRQPLTPADVEAVRTIAASTGFTPLYLPGANLPSDFNRLLTTADPHRFVASYPYDISAVNDDRPFFFYNARLSNVFQFGESLRLLAGVLAISLVATAVVLLLPPLILSSRIPREGATLLFLLYFVCIGAGYILVQVSLIQKFVLFLGHPTYALTVIIFSMLVFSSMGSFFSRQLAQGGQRLHLVLSMAAATVLLLALLVPFVTDLGGTWPRTAKVIAAVALIAPPAFLMGVPFPIALAALEARHKHAVRWAWALNAAASVLGSAAAVFIGVHLGLTATLLCGALLYLAAQAVWKRSQVQPVNTTRTQPPEFATNL